MKESVSNGIVRTGEGFVPTTTSGEPPIKALVVLEGIAPWVPMVIAALKGQSVEASGGYGGMAWQIKIGS